MKGLLGKKYAAASKKKKVKRDKGKNLLLCHKKFFMTMSDNKRDVFIHIIIQSFSLFAEQVCEERSRLDKRDKRKARRRAIKTKSKKEKEKDEKAPRGSSINHKKPGQCFQVNMFYCVTFYHIASLCIILLPSLGCGDILFLRQSPSLPPVQKRFRQPEPVKKVKRKSRSKIGQKDKEKV